MAPDAAGRRPRLVSTVRFRVTATATVVLALTLFAAGIVIVGAQRRILEDNLDEALTQAADSIEAELAAARVPSVLGGFGDEDAIVQIVAPGGEIEVATANAAGLRPVADAPPAGRRSVVRDVQVPDLDDRDDRHEDLDPYRVLTRRVDGPEGPLVLHVAGSLDDLDESGSALVASLAIAAPLLTGLLAGLVWWLTGRTLRPVEALRAEVAAMGGIDAAGRVVEPGTGDEIDRLARTMNAMLGRLERSVRQQQRFVADASHELRSPLTRMRTELEVDLAHPDAADLLATHRSVLEELQGLERLVADLLYLARSDAGAVPAARDVVDLRSIAEDHATRPRSPGPQVTIEGSERAVVTGDRSQLARAVGNVVDNAVRHARRHVLITLSAEPSAIALAVADDGPGIPPEERDHVFDRFVRLDEARSGGAGGAGLGLAIAREIVGRHGGTITAGAPASGRGALVVIRLPAPTRSPGTPS